MEALSELELQREIVQPLLQRIGFRQVRDTSGPTERGKDFVAVIDDAFGRPTLYAVQLKKAKLNAKAGSNESFGRLLDQLAQAALEPVLDPDTLVRRVPDRVVFVTPFAVPIRVREGFLERARDERLRNVEILDGPRLLELIAGNAPELLSRLDLETQYRYIAGAELRRAKEAVLALQLSHDVDLDRTYVQLEFSAGTLKSQLLIECASTSQVLVPSEVAIRLSSKLDRFWPAPASSPITAATVATLLRRLVDAYRNRLAAISALADPACDAELCQQVFSTGVAISACAAAVANDEFVRAQWDNIVEPSGANARVGTYDVAIANVLKCDNPIVVLGGPGAGKSTLLKRLASHELKVPGRLPVFVRLIDLGQPTRSALVTASVAVLEAAGLSKDHFDRHLDAGTLTLCLDGLDETGSRALPLWRVVKQFSTDYPTAKLVLSCRDSVVLPWEPAVPIYLAPFTNEQMRRFVRNWLSVESDRRRLLDWLEASPAMRELARTPLIAALLCSLVDARADLPDTETDLYSSRLALLLGQWDRAKGIVTLVPRVRQRYLLFLQTLAMFLQLSERRTASVDEAQRLAKRFAVKRLHGNEVELVEDCVRRGILERELTGELSFGHLTNQEFLASGWLVRQNDSELIWSLLYKPWWRKTLEFYARQHEDLSSLLAYGRRFLADEAAAGVLSELRAHAPLTTEGSWNRYMSERRGTRRAYAPPSARDPLEILAIR